MSAAGRTVAAIASARTARWAAAAGLACAALPALSQSDAAQAQQQYQQRIAACDTTQPRPQYNACVRAAGAALDRAGITSSGAVQAESSDGRATISQPAAGEGVGNALPAVPSQTITSPDGRATLVVPSDSTLRGTVR